MRWAGVLSPFCHWGQVLLPGGMEQKFVACLTIRLVFCGQTTQGGNGAQTLYLLPWLTMYSGFLLQADGASAAGRKSTVNRYIPQHTTPLLVLVPGRMRSIWASPRA